MQSSSGILDEVPSKWNPWTRINKVGVFGIDQTQIRHKARCFGTDTEVAVFSYWRWTLWWKCPRQLSSGNEQTQGLFYELIFQRRRPTKITWSFQSVKGWKRYKSGFGKVEHGVFMPETLFLRNKNGFRKRRWFLELIHRLSANRQVVRRRGKSDLPLTLNSFISVSNPRLAF